MSSARLRASRMALVKSRPVPWSRSAAPTVGVLSVCPECGMEAGAGSCEKPSVSSEMEIAKREIISCVLSVAVTQHGESCGPWL
eukprot:11018439-Heterocapsa_arctica.AAC.1